MALALTALAATTVTPSHCSYTCLALTIKSIRELRLKNLPKRDLDSRMHVLCAQFITRPSHQTPHLAAHANLLNFHLIALWRLWLLP